MKSLCVITAFGERLGGSDKTLYTFLRHLDRGRFDALVVFLGPGPFEREVAELGLRTRVLPGGKLRNPAHVAATATRLARVLRRERPDLVMSWLSTSHLYAGPAAAAVGMADRTMWWQRDLFAGRAPERARMRDRLAVARGRVLDQLATLVPAVAVGGGSQAVADAQRRMWPHRRTFAVLPGIDAPSQASAGELRALQAGLGIPTEGTVIGTVGRLFAWKGHHRLLRALAILREQHPLVHGLFVGGGAHRPDPGYEAYLRELVRDLSLEDSVSFTGQVPDAAPYMQLMDVFVNASSPEPFGLVLLEAMALGAPVIAVAAGGPLEIVEDGRSGLLVPTGEPQDLAAGIIRVLGDDALRAGIAAGGRARYLERFTGERMTREMEERLLELAG